MYDVDGDVVEESFKPMVELNEHQVGIYERTDLTGDPEYPALEGCCFAYEFKVRVFVERRFDERDHMVLFDYLESFYEHERQQGEDDEEFT